MTCPAPRHPPPSSSARHPDLAAYDLILVNSSAGKDSQAMLDYVVALADGAGVRQRVEVVHADLGRVEWEGTRELAEAQAAHYGLPFHVVQRDGDLLLQIEQRHHALEQRTLDVVTLAGAGITTWAHAHAAGGDALAALIGDATPEHAPWLMTLEPHARARRLHQTATKRAGAGEGAETIDFGTNVPWPSSQARYCTSDQKTAQVRKLITALHRERLPGQSFSVLNSLGLRAEESPGRARKPTFSRERPASTVLRHVDRWLPIQHWSEADVWRVIKASGVPYHRAYDLGMSRLSCAVCVFASKGDLAVAREHNPRLLAEYVQLEERVGSTFRDGESIARDAVGARKAGERLSPFR